MKAAYKRIANTAVIQADILNTDGQSHEDTLEEQGFAQTEAILAVAQALTELTGEVAEVNRNLIHLR
jgi:glycine cleavage system H lipoate-binding protein